MESSTKILRRMLDERGVEWMPSVWSAKDETFYKVGDVGYLATELSSGKMKVCIEGYLTPEQAIAATLGATDARPTQAESSGTCHDEGDPSDFCCSECGVRMFTNTSDTYTMIASDGRTIIKHPNYCPNCGRRCVG